MKRKRRRTSVESRRAERELLFWTIRQTYKVVLLGAITICALLALAEDEIVGRHFVSQLLAKASALFA